MKKPYKNMVRCGLFAALTAVLSQIAIPLPFTPVAINAAGLSALLAGGLSGAGYGGLSQLIYLLMGAVGLPVFSGFSGGIGVLLGPSGGFLIAYPLCSILTGYILSKNRKIAALVSGTLVCYVLGTIQFCIVTSLPLAAAVAACVLPFLPGDILKIILAYNIFSRLGNKKI